MKQHHGKLLASLGLSAGVVGRLHSCSFIHGDDLSDFSPTQLLEVTGLSLAECCEVLRLCSATLPSSGETVLDMIEDMESLSHVVTMCPSLDEVLGGGIALGALTEVVGTPGTGKTQLCLQLSVSVQLPRWCHGMEGEAVFIDSEGSFVASRLVEIAEAALSHCDQLYASRPCQTAADKAPFNLESILRNIHYYRCLSQLSVASCIKLLPSLLAERPRIRILIIDSIAFHLRHDIPDNRLRTSHLYAMTQDLIQLATKHQVAVLVTNQMTTRVQSQTPAATQLSGKSAHHSREGATDSGHASGVKVPCSPSTQTIAGSRISGPDLKRYRNYSEGMENSSSLGRVSENEGVGSLLNASLTPALGESWGHCASIRLLLRWQEGKRTATLLKSPHTATGTTYYAVTAAGIRGTLNSSG